jgi:hypothetical protein
LLNHDRAGSNLRASYQGADLNLDEIAPTQLAIDGKIEHRPITQSASRSRKKRIAQTWRGFNARFAPTFFPAFQARRSCAAGLYCEVPMMLLLLPTHRRKENGSIRERAFLSRERTDRH